jgi:ATP-dependent DNA helicase PIF1
VLFLVQCRPAHPPDFLERFRLALFPPGCNSQQVWLELNSIAAECRTNLSVHGLGPPEPMNRAEVPLLARFNRQQCEADADRLWAQLNAEQRAVAEGIMTVVVAPQGASRVIMLQAAGGCGKSFVSNYVAARVRSRGLTAICVAASAQAAAVLKGGRTAHGQLHIPLECDDSSYLDLTVNQKEEIANAAVIIWDEASMVSSSVADCVDRSLRDIMNNALPFGGMPVVFCGDFRQLLPVVRGGRGEYNTIQTCAWWREVTMLKLHHNWRCQQPEWLQLLDDIGMGRIDSVDIPAAATRPTMQDVVQFVWHDAASCTSESKGVLTLTLEDAAAVNVMVISQLPGDGTIALSCDTFVDCKEPDLYPEEFVRSLKISGVAPGQLDLKVGARYIIIRNIDAANGIVNGAHILCTAVSRRTVSGEGHVTCCDDNLMMLQALLFTASTQAPVSRCRE